LAFVATETQRQHTTGNSIFLVRDKYKGSHFLCETLISKTTRKYYRMKLYAIMGVAR